MPLRYMTAVELQSTIGKLDLIIVCVCVFFLLNVNHIPYAFFVLCGPQDSTILTQQKKIWSTSSLFLRISSCLTSTSARRHEPQTTLSICKHYAKICFAKVRLISLRRSTIAVEYLFLLDVRTILC